MPVRTLRIPVTNAPAEFYSDLREALRLAAQTANECIRYCVAIDDDIFKSLSTAELEQMPKIYTYPLFAPLYKGRTNECASITRDVERDYKRVRREVAIGKKSFPNYRSYPWPLLRQYLDLHIKDEQIYLCVRLPNEEWEVPLRGGSQYARQISLLKKILYAGDGSKIRDSKIWIDRRGVAVVGLAVEIDAKSSIGDAEMHVSTSRDHFLVCTKEKLTTPFCINADHVIGWQTERNRKSGRIRQDMKMGNRSALQRRLEDISRKYRNRLKSFVQESAAHVVSHARRNGCNRIVYNDTIRSYFRDFTWFEMCETLKNKCEEFDIEFERRSAALAEYTPDKPHVYFMLAVDAASGRSLGKVKIGFTTDNKRKRNLETASGQNMVLLAADCQPKNKLREIEKKYHAMFACHKLPNMVEYFAAQPVIDWLRDVACLGNTGNHAQIAQYVDL